MSHAIEKPITPDGEFIIVNDGNSFMLGVSAVKPGAEIVFQGIGDLVPIFQGTNPFSGSTKSDHELLCPVLASCSPGAYSFGLSASSGAPTSYPYTIHVVADGASKATYRMVSEKLRVVLTLAGQTLVPLHINLKKEGFTAPVKVNVDHAGQLDSFTIAAGVPEFLWSVTPAGGKEIFTFAVAPPNETPDLPNILHSEVIGSDESDLDILPPEG